MTTLRVSWPANPAVEQVSKYEVFRSLNGSAFASLGQIVGTQLDIPNPSTGIHQYKVKAINVAGSSVESDIGNGPPVPSKPGTPEVTVIES